VPGSLSVYPNPAEELVTIEAGNHESVSVELRTQGGKLVYRQEMKETNTAIDLSPFSQGVYFITIRSNDLVSTEKIIKL